MADIQQANSTTVSSNLCATSSSASTMIQNAESSLSVDVHEIQTQPGTDQSQNVKAQAYPKRRTNHESIYRYVSSPYFSSPSSYAMNKRRRLIQANHAFEATQESKSNSCSNKSNEHEQWKESDLDRASKVSSKGDPAINNTSSSTSSTPPPKNTTSVKDDRKTLLSFPQKKESSKILLTSLQSRLKELKRQNKMIKDTKKYLHGHQVQMWANYQQSLEQLSKINDKRDAPLDIVLPPGTIF